MAIIRCAAPWRARYGLALLAALAAQCVAACGGGGGGGNPPPPPQNQAPTADIDASTVLGNAPFAVDFTGGGSTDPDGSIAAYQWDLDGDGFVDHDSPLPKVTHMYTTPGTVTVVLQVVDDDGAADTTTVPIIVGAPAPDRVVVSTDGDGSDPAFSMVTVAGNPAAAFRQDGNQKLVFARATDAQGGGWTLADIAVEQVGYCSLSIVNGVPAVAYVRTSDMSLNYTEADDATGSAWHMPVDTGYVVPDWRAAPTLLSADGFPAIVFEQQNQATLQTEVHYARALDASGDAWPEASTRVSAPGMGGATPGAEIVGGRPAVAFEGGGVVYTRALDSAGSAWPIAPVFVGAINNPDGYYQLAIVRGRAAILCRSDDGLLLAHAADDAGDAWGGLDVIMPPSVPIAHYQRLALVGGFPMVAFELTTGSTMQLLVGDDIAGLEFSTRLEVDPANSDGCGLLDVGGRPGVMFRDIGTEDIIFRRL